MNGFALPHVARPAKPLPDGVGYLIAAAASLASWTLIAALLWNLGS